MRPAVVWTIVRKELVETLRDRRTLARLILIPVLLYPLFAIGVSKLVGSASEAREARASRIAVWGELPPELARRLGADAKLELRPWAGAPREVRRDIEAGALGPPPTVPELERIVEAAEDAASTPTTDDDDKAQWTEPPGPLLDAARAAVVRREVDAVLIPWTGLRAELPRGGKSAIAIYYDSVRADSSTAQERLERALRRSRKEILAEREVARDLPPGFTTGYHVVSRNVATDTRLAGKLLGSMMPMMLILMSLLGSFLPAIDLTAGEKERGTMQTLLCAPLLSIEIISGKFLAVWCMALLTALANVVSLAFTVRRLLPDVVTIAPSVFALTFLLLIPVTFLFAAIFLALAVFAKDFKDGQNALMPAYLPLTLLAAITALPVVELNPWTAYAPVLNIAVLIKALFIGDAPVDLIFTTLFSSAIYACLGLLLAARVFERDHVLLGGHESARTVLGLSRRAGGEPSAGFSLAALAVIQVLFFYGSLFLARASIAAQLAASQLGFFLLPTLALVLGFGYSPRSTLALRPPTPRGLAGALLVGASTWAVVGGIVVRLFPPPESLSRELGKVVLLDGSPFPLVLLLVALTPAICEELLFRGLVFSGLRRSGPVVAIAVSALLFGLAHGSVYRLLPTASLGLALGYARHRTGSIVPGMVIHAMNNGLLVSILYFDPGWVRNALDGALPWSVTAAGAAVFAAGALLLRGAPRGEGPR